MHIAFHVSPRKVFEQTLGDGFEIGAKRHGDTTSFPLEFYSGADVACVIGVKDANLMNRYRRAGVPVIYWDKAYTRRKGLFRVAINSNHPTRYIMDLNCPSDRRKRFKWRPEPWRPAGGGSIIIAGSSGKYHSMVALQPAQQWAEQTIQSVRRYSNREIIYRPKLTHNDAKEIPGTTFSRGGEFLSILKGAHVVITQGSNAGFEAMLYGVPSIVLGQAVVRPISSTRIADVENPKLASDKERIRFLNNLAYHQWTPSELQDGKAWEWLKEGIVKCGSM